MDSFPLWVPWQQPRAPKSPLLGNSPQIIIGVLIIVSVYIYTYIHKYVSIHIHIYVHRCKGLLEALGLAVALPRRLRHSFVFWAAGRFESGFKLRGVLTGLKHLPLAQEMIVVMRTICGTLRLCQNCLSPFVRTVPYDDAPVAYSNLPLLGGSADSVSPGSILLELDYKAEVLSHPRVAAPKLMT